MARTRCKNGFRKNKAGICAKKEVKQTKKRCQKGFRKNKAGISRLCTWRLGGVKSGKFVEVVSEVVT